MDPTYNKFGYYEEMASTSRFILRQEDFWMTSLFQKLVYKTYHFDEHMFVNKIACWKRDQCILLSNLRI